ncbi:hypothetical protein [Helcococcus ovis]
MMGSENKKVRKNSPSKIGKCKKAGVKFRKIKDLLIPPPQT